MIKTFGFMILTMASLTLGINYAQADNPVELGKVNWNRDFDQAKALSAKSGKPIFIQFQEVPG